MNKETKKQIRFIDENYNTLFRIDDGESIVIKEPDGTQKQYECHYLDDYHCKIGSCVYHIREFAECSKRGGFVVEAANQNK